MSRRQLKLAALAFERGDMGQVAQVLTPAVVSRARNGAARDHLRAIRAHALLAVGRPQDALDALTGASWQGAYGALVCRLVAAANLVLGDLARAEHVLQQLETHGDGDAKCVRHGVMAQLGLSALASGDLVTASRWLRVVDIAILADDRLRYAAWIGLLEVAGRNGEHTEVTRLFGVFPQWSSDPQANLLAARTAVLGGDKDTALRHLRACSPQAELPQLWWRLCRDLHARRRHADVVAIFGKTQPSDKLDRHGRAILVLLAYSLHTLGRSQQAQACIDRLAACLPDDESLRFHAGRLAYLRGDLGRARQFLDALTRGLWGKAARPLRRRIAFHQGKHDWFCRYLTLAQLSQPRTDEEWPLMRVLAAIACARLGHFDHAAERTALIEDDALDPSTREAVRRLRGVIALHSGRWAQARTFLEGTPLAAHATLEHARYAADRGKLDQATSALESIPGSSALGAHVADTRATVAILRVAMLLTRPRTGRWLDAAIAEWNQFGRSVPAVAATMVWLGDRMAVLSALSAADQNPTGASARRLLDLSVKPVGGGPEPAVQARQRDLSYLAAVVAVRALERATTRVPAERAHELAFIASALERVIAIDPAFASAGAMLAVIEWHRGDTARVVDRVQFAIESGIASPVLDKILRAEYFRCGRWGEAKRLFFDAIASARGPGAVGLEDRGIREILAHESAPVLRPARPPRPSPTNGAADESANGALDRDDLLALLDESMSPLDGSDALDRAPMLIDHIERHIFHAGKRGQGKWRQMIDEIERCVRRRDANGVAAAENRAFELMR